MKRVGSYFTICCPHRQNQCELSGRAYLARLIEGKPVKACPSPEIGLLRTEIHHIGNNINQIARSTNAGIAREEDARQAVYPVGTGLRIDVLDRKQIMVITKILAQRAGLDKSIAYILNGDKTESQILTAYQNCDPGIAYCEMMTTKQRYGREGDVQGCHMIQSFRLCKITPQSAFQIAKEFSREHLAGYEVVIGTHVDKKHIHSHLVRPDRAIGKAEKGTSL